MFKTYNNHSELLREVLDIKIIDLTPYVLGLDPSLLNALEDDVSGWYLPHSVEPVFHLDKNYILFDGKNEVIINDKHISDAILNNAELPKGNIYGSDRKLIMTRTAFYRNRTFFKTEPTVSTAGYRAAIAVILTHLNSLCSFTNVAERGYKLPLMVKEEYQYLLETNTFESAFDDLILEVLDFTRGFEWNIYHYRVSGMSIIIERGLDFRIYEWHLNEIRKRDGYDHDHGGVLDGYSTASKETSYA